MFTPDVTEYVLEAIVRRMGQIGDRESAEFMALSEAKVSMETSAKIVPATFRIGEGQYTLSMLREFSEQTEPFYLGPDTTADFVNAGLAYRKSEWGGHRPTEALKQWVAVQA